MSETLDANSTVYKLLSDVAVCYVGLAALQPERLAVERSFKSRVYKKELLLQAPLLYEQLRTVQVAYGKHLNKFTPTQLDTYHYWNGVKRMLNVHTIGRTVLQQAPDSSLLHNDMPQALISSSWLWDLSDSYDLQLDTVISDLAAKSVPDQDDHERFYNAFCVGARAAHVLDANNRHLQAAQQANTMASHDLSTL